MSKKTTNLIRRVGLEEDGWALVTAMVLMVIMLTTGLAVASQLDTQSRMSGVTRNRETAFNLAEAALNAQVFALAGEWPGQGYRGTPQTTRTVWTATTTQGNQYAPCTEANTGAAEVRCPNVSQLRGLFPTPDADPDARWQTRVIDNVDPYKTYYSDAALTGAVGYDSNGDDMVWVRATATVKGRTRTLVSLVRAEHQFEDILHSAVVAGALSFGNMGANGNKTFITTDGTTPSLMVGVRCQYDPPLTSSTECLGYAENDFNTDDKWEDALQQGVSPFVVQQNYAVPTAMTPEALAREIDTAQKQGTYFTPSNTSNICDPSNVDAGENKAYKVVVLDFHGTCTYNGNDQFNSPDNYGMLILLNSDSRVVFGGTTTFYGVIYHANLPAPGSSDYLVSTDGNAHIEGGVLIDGPGRMFAGQSGVNIKYVEKAFGSVQSIATAGIIQNTWRELNAGS